MSTLSPSALTTDYICKYCRRGFNFSGPPIVGEKTHERLMRVQKQMVDHLGQEHKEQMATIMMAGPQFQGWLISQQFANNDADLLRECEPIRLGLRRTTQRVHITDEIIAAQVEKHLVGDDPEELRKAAIGLLKGIRDTMDEVPVKREAV
jgi:hypothetical protein